MRQRRLSYTDGFTLIELVVVIAIISILMTIAIVNMISWRADRQVRGTAYAYYADLQKARLAAVRRAEFVSVVMDSPSGDYQIFIDIDQDFNLEPADGDVMLKQVSILPNVQIANVTFPAHLTQYGTQFNERGMGMFPGNLDFVNLSGDSASVFLNIVGRMWIQE